MGDLFDCTIVGELAAVAERGSQEEPSTIRFQGTAEIPWRPHVKEHLHVLGVKFRVKAIAQCVGLWATRDLGLPVVRLEPATVVGETYKEFVDQMSEAEFWTVEVLH